ncbi:MAG: CbiX/SirB N-terminal domain-containing protein [Curvibacter sp.]|nr:CbiX/SirB N-terminal domain-containing protein [Curvibacter sp.]
MPQPAIILFAHGSRDPAWSAPIQAVAQRIRHLSPQTEVRCAYLELMAPNLAGACAELVAQGQRRIRVVPMFLGVGRHAREDLPVLLQSLQTAHPGIELELLPAIGESAHIVNALATLALSAGADFH